MKNRTKLAAGAGAALAVVGAGGAVAADKLTPKEESKAVVEDAAKQLGVDPAKYHVGIGQDAFSVPAPDEDIVTMGAAAAKQVIDRHGSDGIRTVLFATESGIDQSKAAGVFVHGLLGLPQAVRVVELKQACYGGAAALQLALGIIARNPDERVLVIAADVARYDVDTAAEPTQGAGAVAVLGWRALRRR